MMSLRERLNPIEIYSAFSLTAAPLLLWCLAGFLTEPSHRKSLDYAVYALLFGVGPILVWLAARRIERFSSELSLRMHWATSAQALLVLLILVLVWLPHEQLKRVWFLPCVIHLSVLVALSWRHRVLDQYLERSSKAAHLIFQALVPILPVLVFSDVLAFSPDLRGGLIRFSHSHSFLVGMTSGSVLAVGALWALRRERPSFASQRINSIGGVVSGFVAVVAVALLTDTSLIFDWIHYGTYIGPASAVLHGRFPTVDAFSQYGLLNYLLYSLGFLLSPYPTLTVAAAVSGLVNLVTYASMLILLKRLCRANWFATLFGILIIFIASHLALSHNINPYPNFRGMRFLPAALIAVSLVAIPVGRRFTVLSIFAFVFGLLWSFEGAVCVIGSYIAYLVVIESTGARCVRLLATLSFIALGTYATFSLSTLIATGSLPLFNVYLNLVFGYVNVGTYAAAIWLAPIDPHELIWVPLVFLYFGVIAVGWRSLVERKYERPNKEDNIFMARIVAVTACGVILLSLFVLRSLIVYLLVAAPLGLVLFFALTAAVWSDSSSSPIIRTAIGLPFILIVALSTAVLANVFYEKNPKKVITHDVSAAHDWIRTRANVFSIAWKRLKSPDADYDIGMSFPWKQNRMRESSELIRQWFPTEKAMIVFVPEAAAILLRERKADRFPISYSLSELMTPAVNEHVARASAAVRLIEGEKLLISNNANELNILETRILKQVLAEWDVRPVKTGKFVTVYRLVKKSFPPPTDRLILPLPIVAATESSAMLPLTSGDAAADSWEATRWSTRLSKSSSKEWLQVDLGEVKSLTRIELVPYWPAVDAFPSRFAVLVTSDGSSWTKIAAEEKFTPDWAGYQARSISGYRIDLPLMQVRWIRVEAEVPYSPSQKAYVLQISDILAFGQ